MKCINCGKEIESDAKFCVHCGQSVEHSLLCPKCGKPFAEEDVFCTSCGTKIENRGKVMESENNRFEPTHKQNSSKTPDFGNASPIFAKT